MSGRAPEIEAFAVDATSVQLIWRDSPQGKLLASVGDREVVADSDGGPGGLVIDELEPGSAHVGSIIWPGRAESRVAFHTLAARRGPVLARIATVSDLHIGSAEFGFRETIREPATAGERVMMRCHRMALAEAVAWGADLIVVKGDVTHAGRRYEWAQAAELFAEVPVPLVIVPGNHESYLYRSIEPWQAGEQFGLHVVDKVESIDLPGIRVVAATTAVPGRSRGRLAPRIDAILEAAAGAEAALVTLHHQLEFFPDLPMWPPGIVRSQADAFLDRLALAQPASLVTSGHTHRNRRRQHGPVTVTQVGSTKDYPGVWAGYTVQQDGISQLVRRIDDPECLRWTDTTRRAAAGLWPRLSKGPLPSRCFTIPWHKNA